MYEGTQEDNESGYSPINNVQTFLESWASPEHSSEENRLKARVQLDKRRIKLIRPRSESNRTLQSRGKAGCQCAAPLNEWHRFFRVKANPRSPSPDFNKRDRGSLSRPRNSINRIAQLLATGRPHPIESIESPQGVRKRSKKMMRLNSTSPRAPSSRRSTSISFRRESWRFHTWITSFK